MSGEKQMSHQTVTNKFRAGLGEPTNEASAEEKFILIMPCKEEEDEVNAYLLTKRSTVGAEDDRVDGRSGQS